MDRLYTVDREERARIGELVMSELTGERAVGFAYLYGSFLEGDSFHDVDVGIYLRDPVQEDTDYATALGQRLTAAIKFPVDVRVINHAPVSFLFHVLKGRILLSQDDDLLATVMETTARRYLDMAPLLRQSTREAFGA